jgi:hypothetical protein
MVRGSAAGAASDGAASSGRSSEPAPAGVRFFIVLRSSQPAGGQEITLVQKGGLDYPAFPFIGIISGPAIFDHNGRKREARVARGRGAFTLGVAQ